MSFALAIIVLRLAVFPLAYWALVCAVVLRPRYREFWLSSCLLSASVTALVAIVIAAEQSRAATLPQNTWISSLFTLFLVLSAASYCAQHFCRSAGRNFWRGDPVPGGKSSLSHYGLWVLLLVAMLLLNPLIFITVGLTPLSAAELGERVLFTWALTQLAYALGEEIFFRGYLLALFDHLFRGKFWGRHLSVVIVTVLFIVQHSGGNALLFKFIQITPVSLVLIYVFRRYGLVGAFLFHAIYNLSGDYLLILMIG